MKVDVQVATIQTITSAKSRNSLNTGSYDLVIVDEAHNIGTQKRYDAIKGFAKIVGFTATPFRHSGRLKSPEQYGFNIIQSLPLPEAQDIRLLPPLCGVQLDTKGLVDEVPMTLSGKIDFKRLEKLLKDSPDLRPFIADRVAKMISSDDKKYKTVIAVNFVWEAQELASLLREKGIKVGVGVNERASKEIHTEDIPAVGAIERYKLPHDDPNGLQVLISPYVASEGFDAPFTEVLVWASPTDSSVRYTQYTGRLARRAPGKAFGVVVDCLYQTSQYSWTYNFGMWMKGNVRQLENGLLWLGPETDIDNLKDLSQLQMLRSFNDIQSLENLQKEAITREIPQGWVTMNQLKEILNRSNPSIRRIMKTYQETNPEWFQLVLNDNGKLANIYSPEIVKVLTEKYLGTSTAPEGWQSPNQLVGVLERSFATIKKIAKKYSKDHPEWFQIYLNQSNQKAEYYHPDLVAKVYQELTSVSQKPDGWMNADQLSAQVGLSSATVRKLASKLLKSHPEWGKEFIDASNHANVQYSPELIHEIQEHSRRRLPPPPGWQTVNQIRISLNKSEAAILGRIAKIDQDRLAKNSGFFAHEKRKGTNYYSPEIIDYIRASLS